MVLFFSAFLAIILAGFLPSYFAPLASNAQGFPWQIHFHALCMTSWSLLMLAQAYLIKKNDFRVHRFIGKCSYYLVPVLILSIALVIRWSVLKNIAIAPRKNVLGFMWVSVTDVISFAVFYALAIYNKMDQSLHSRYMVSAALALLPPAIVRIVGRWLPPIAWLSPLQITLGIVDIWFLALIFRDKLKYRVYSAYPYALGFYGLIQITRPVIQSSGIWQRLAATLVGL